ncbi:PfkB family carbohydrate kinase [Streptantibioticus cattleyicolor]|uniref:PfkB domain protein n=1 Tax=Streptantibioticus cattleyicolor (strain ATCC 35852 / DSM 46488 / JCM 4925 / NBRC 14057 / NRRL 8057) TaxID=1003195 RepID=F8JJE4_STREN|nr:PfkB family carbohydrate kinase [Streptantibioticus cattleyicolor]AEW98733.1 PfkB domain protein [Streptantibioticus cattleyicolor NRRL 8057 = DSM 46488]CCB72214.1 putative sugar kinase [Streptantibioticus cattleyicolor NRRL 8057 = DSM 46488]
MSAPLLVTGEALVDLVPAADGDGSRYVAYPGGAPANLAVGLARLGLPVAFAGGIGRDAFAALGADRLTGAGVDLTPSARTALPTALAVADPGPDGTAYDFHITGTATFRVPALTDGLERYAAVCVGGLAAVTAPAHDAVAATAEAAAARSTLVVDPNARSGTDDEGRARLVRLCQLAHLVKVSDEDVRLLWPDEPVEDTCRRLAGDGRLVVLTRGADGSTAFTPGGLRVDVPVVPVQVVDTIGAGDAFTAGLLARLAGSGLLAPDSLADLTHHQLDDALRLGARTAAAVCARAGADLVVPADIAADLAGPGRPAAHITRRSH